MGMMINSRGKLKGWTQRCSHWKGWNSKILIRNSSLSFRSKSSSSSPMWNRPLPIWLRISKSNSLISTLLIMWKPSRRLIKSKKWVLMLRWIRMIMWKRLIGHSLCWICGELACWMRTIRISKSKITKHSERPSLFLQAPTPRPHSEPSVVTVSALPTSPQHHPLLC